MPASRTPSFIDTRIRVDVTATGPYEAVAELCMGLAQSLDVQLLLAHSGDLFVDGFETHGVRSPAVTLHHFAVTDPLRSTAFTPAPVRFPCNFSETWHAPLSPEHVKGARSSGIAPLAAVSRSGSMTAPLAQAAFTLSVSSAPPERLMQVLSQRFPELVLGMAYSRAVSSVIGKAFVGGTEALRVSENEAQLHPGTATLDPSDAEVSPAQQCINDYALRIAPVLSEKGVDKFSASPHGWPRWSLLAHAAYDGGVKGFERALHGLGFGGLGPGVPAGQLSPGRQAEVLLDDARQARALGVASWADTLMFGSRRDQNPHAERASVFRIPRQRELLRLVGLAAGSPEAPAVPAALLASLSCPSLRLLNGTHPIAHLAAAVGRSGRYTRMAELREDEERGEAGAWSPPGEQELRGMDALLDGLSRAMPELSDAKDLNTPLRAFGPVAEDYCRPDADGEPELLGPRLNPGYTFDVEKDRLLASALAIAVELPGRAAALRPALAAGVPAGFLFRSVVWSDCFHRPADELSLTDPASAPGSGSGGSAAVSRSLTAFKEVFGSLRDFPEDLKQEMQRLGPGGSAAYQAYLTAERMRDVIEAAQARAQAPLSPPSPLASTPPPAPIRRRQSTAC